MLSWFKSHRQYFFKFASPVVVPDHLCDYIQYKVILSYGFGEVVNNRQHKPPDVLFSSTLCGCYPNLLCDYFHLIICFELWFLWSCEWHSESTTSCFLCIYVNPSLFFVEHVVYGNISMLKANFMEPMCFILIFSFYFSF